jgi:hypothetical protein
MLEIALDWKARSTNRRQAGVSASANRESLRTRITPADGNETETSSRLISGWLARGLIDESSPADVRAHRDSIGDLP